MDIRVRKTHDLETLLKECIELDPGFTELDEEMIARISRYAVEVRYPGETISIDQDELIKIADTAKHIKEFTSTILQNKGFIE